MDFLKSAVASAISKGPPFPYTFGDKVDVDNSIWALHNGTKREDGSNCSIFSFDVTANKSRLPLAKNALRKWRTLRHPGIVKVLDTVETETYIYIATERVTPLGWHVRRKALSIETIKWGLFTIASTLKFIHDEASSVHGNVRVSSILTSESGEWKVGGLEILSSMKEDDAVIYTYATLVPDINRYAAPEIAKGGWDSIKRNPLAAADSYDFGLLIFAVFNAGDLGMDSVGQTKNIPSTMHQSYKRLLNANPKARLTITHFLDQGRRSAGFLDTPLIKLSEGVESLGLKNDEERAELLSELDQVSEDFPEDFFKMKILPELLKSVEFGGGGPKVFGFVMKMGAKLSDDEYESMLNPVILRLFVSPDRQIRVCLLDNLPSMIDHFTQKIVTDKVFPQLVTGFTDIAPLVREQTVKSVLTIVPKLSERIINGELLKYLAKTANDEQPGIRTNTTICLGKIARNMGANTRQKVLLAAFSRSLRDPFVHGRNAALQALAATADLFTEDDAANKIMPAICPLLLDKEKMVRDQANKTFDIYLGRIRKHSSTLPETALPPPTTNPTNGATPRTGTPQNDTNASAASWTGWAVSSFTNKLAAASGDIQALAKPGGPPTPLFSPAADSHPPSALSLPRHSPIPSRPAPKSAASALHRKALVSPTGPPAPVLTSTGTEKYFDAAQDVDDELDAAWGEPGDAFFEAPKPVPATPTLFDDGGEPDFAGWLSAQAAAKAKPVLPKGLKKEAPKAGMRLAAGAGAGAGAAAGAKKAVGKVVGTPRVVEAKAIDTKPKDTGEDDWGDAWT